VRGDLYHGSSGGGVSDLANDAVVALTTLVNGALSGAGAVGVLVTPVKVSPVGLGGFVSHNAEPPGDVEGARVDASVRVTVQSNSMGGLNTAATIVTRSLISLGEAERREAGLLRIGLDPPGSNIRSLTGNNMQQDVHFRLLYEFIRVPEEGGGIIQEIPIHLHPESMAWLELSFGAAALAWFDIVDDPAATTEAPSAWGVDVPGRRIIQTSGIRGGSNAANANKPGTQLLLRPRPDVPPLVDVRLETTLRTGSPGGAGLVFRSRGEDDFYFFLLDPAAGYVLLGKKVAGAYTALDSGGLALDPELESDRHYAVRLVARGDTFSVSLDGVEVVTGVDSSLVAPGRVGFMTRRTTGAAFTGLRISPP